MQREGLGERRCPRDGGTHGGGDAPVAPVLTVVWLTWRWRSRGDSGHEAAVRTASHGRGVRGGGTKAAAASAEALDDRGIRLATALAHGLQAIPAAGALELVQQLGHQDRAGGPERVPERDRAAVGVGLLE
jgi:hypothetical protein